MLASGARRLVACCLVVAMLIFAGAASALMVTPAPVSAASCSGTGCNGQDPGTTGCTSGSYTVYSATNTFWASSTFWATVSVDLRWSPTCQTNWARAAVTSSNPSTYAFQIQVMLKGSSYNTIWHTEYAGIGRQVYGDMHYPPTQPVRACAYVNDFGGPPVCTALG
jgi:hypothetical protein